MCQTTSCSFKDQGNAEYKKGNWLKAAGLYTKGIKEDPDSAVLYSNRSAALLQLKKAGKALEDAEECIRRRPEWDKGHYRKGLALELQGAHSEALQSVETALKFNPENAEMIKKARELRKLRDCSKSTKKDKENQDKNQSSSRDSGSKFAFKATTKENQGAQQMIPPKAVDADTAEFERECLSLALDTEAVEPSVYFLGPPAADVESSMSQVRIKEAFQSPDLLQICIGFLRQYADEKRARAACAVVPLKDVAYPQVWKRRGWPAGETQGALVQLDAPKERRVWLMPAGAQDVSSALPLSEDFKVLDPLFR